MEPREKKAIESCQKWYKTQSWFGKLFIRLLHLEDVYEGAYCDGWIDCDSQVSGELQELVEEVKEMKRESDPIALLSTN